MYKVRIFPIYTHPKMGKEDLKMVDWEELQQMARDRSGYIPKKYFITVNGVHAIDSTRYLQAIVDIESDRFNVSCSVEHNNGWYRVKADDVPSVLWIDFNRTDICPEYIFLKVSDYMLKISGNSSVN